MWGNFLHSIYNSGWCIWRKELLIFVFQYLNFFRSLRKEYIVVDFSLTGNPRINQKMWVTSTLCQILNFTFVVEEKGFWKALQFVNYLVLQTVSAAPALPPETPRWELLFGFKKQTLTWNPTEAKTTCLCQYTQGFNLTTISLCYTLSADSYTRMTR